MHLISTTAELAAACERLATHPFVTVDTEFLRETTYYPKLCLIQLASPEEAVLVDPLAPELDLAPFFGLMVDGRVVKVFHAARQDLEIVWLLGRVLPTPLFDTQVAAMVCGYGDSVGYEQLANDLAKARIDKSSRFTDWSRRPLTEAQLAYAESDVTHLREIYLALKADLDASGREAWVAEEMAVLSSPATYEVKPENAWLLTWTIQEIYSKGEKPGRKGLFSSEKTTQEFFIDTDDLEAARQGVSSYENHALIPHEAYQALYAAGEAQKIFAGYKVHILSNGQVISDV